MAKKMIFIAGDKLAFKEVIVDYTFVPGFALCQKQKNVNSLHQSIKNRFRDDKILEVSSKSTNELGVKLSAFNLKLDGHFIEQIFQSSKVFMDDKQYLQLLDMPPKDCKKFIKEVPNKQLKKFVYKNQEFPLEPKTLFYDYIYLKALAENPALSSHLKDYDIFTDIEFNYEKSINCQARTCAIYSYLLRNNIVDETLNDINKLIEVYKNSHQSIFSL